MHRPPHCRVRGLSDTRLCHCALLQPIGYGGTAVVHLAVDSDGQMVAIKMLPPPSARNAENRCRLAREVSAMRRIRSPLVAEVIDADVTGPIPYVVTRLVQGQTLAQVIKTEGPLRGPTCGKSRTGSLKGRYRHCLDDLVPRGSCAACLGCRRGRLYRA
jgi:serine/threonine protein kinase